MQPRFGFLWSDLYDPERLATLHDTFLDRLNRSAPKLAGNTQQLHGDELIALALEIESFVIELFRLEAETQVKYDEHHQLRLASHFKRNFIQRDALHSKLDQLSDGPSTLLKLSHHLGQDIDPNDEITFAHLGLAALSREDEIAIDLFRAYAIWACTSNEGQNLHRKGFLFQRPEKIDPFHRFAWEYDKDTIISQHLSPRVGFDLTDPGISTEKANDEAYYCIKCHDRNKDSCRTGFQKDGAYKSDPHGQPLSGCPLDQKISEMNALYEQGHLIAALAVVTLDNPMVAATGHRICYDCSRSCIFQKQTPVDIPAIETRLLKDVLNLPYGFEIYSLLTRWNPLNASLPVALPSSGYHVLVVGQGPSGFALAHLMMRYGHNVTAIDAMKIATLPDNLKNSNTPIKHIAQYWENLSERLAQGFGGVAEYGITSRWDKNFLLVIRLLLERQSLYQCLDSVRFGSSITIESAFHEYGFDHIALCLGAGSPTLLQDPNMTAPGVRLASDFLMGLNLGAAAQLDTKTTLRIQLPAVVIGSGLTAIDAATEALAYYPTQVMNFYLRYQRVLNDSGAEAAKKVLDADPECASTFLKHGKIIFDEHQQAQRENRKPNYLQHTLRWGGVTIYYRRQIQDSPAYKLNPHELKSALQEGVRYVENADPTSIQTDQDGKLSGVSFKQNKESIFAPARTLLVAAGTKPNTVLANECDRELEIDGDFFKLSTLDSPYIHTTNNTHNVSYLGDLHPQFSGSVVKALASAKSIAPRIHKDLIKQGPKRFWFDKNAFKSRVISLRKDGGNLYLKIRSYAAANAYKLGHFFKLQPYGKTFTEAIPLTPIHVNKTNGEIDFQINIVGATTQGLLALKTGAFVSLMGPTGSTLPIKSEDAILFVQEAGFGLGILDQFLQTHPNSELISASISGDIDPEKLKNKRAVFVVGSSTFIDSFEHFSQHVEVFTFVHTHTQCMMKQVCAQCIYSVYDAERNIHEVRFGCAQNIAQINDINRKKIDQRNKNEHLEERLLHAYQLSINKAR